MINTLITSAGRRVALLDGLRADAKMLRIGAKILAVDMQPEFSAACARADQSLRVPKCTDLGYVRQLLEICQSHDIKLVIPTIDTELPVLAQSQQRFRDIGVLLAVSGQDAVAVARDKQATVDRLAAAGVPVARSVPLAALIDGKSSLSGPLVLKRVDGSRSVGLRFVGSVEEAKSLDLDASAYVAQERCLGPEYTINCYVDQAGKLRATVPHHRIEVRDGEVSKGVTERRADLAAIAHNVVAAVPGLRGPFCFQAILSDEGPKVFEINARFGGGYPLAHAAGATFGKWLMEEALGLPCTANDEWQDGLLMLRYDAAVFVKK